MLEVLRVARVIKIKNKSKMTEYSKYNIVYRLQKWMDSVPGQTFLNYSYSWGASIVILGTLFKLTHLPCANLMLYIGMGTEVCVFFISAFDRPFDKTAIDKEIPSHVTDEYLEENEKFKREDVHSPNIVSSHLKGEQFYREKVTFNNIAEQAHSAIQNSEWVGEQQQVSPEMAEATSNYVEELRKLTDMLANVSEQSSRLTRDSEEMENLNRTLTGICKVYEMQLKSASAQIGTIDQINDQSRKMAGQIEQLNKIYARMIDAMTVNMRSATSGASNLDANV